MNCPPVAGSAFASLVANDGTVFPATFLPIIEAPDGALVIIGNADDRDFGVAAENEGRQQVGLLAVIRDPGARADRQRNVSGRADRACHCGVVGRIAAAIDDDVEKGPLRSGFMKLLDYLAILPSRPGPASDLAQGAIVDRNEHDLAAGFVIAKAVPRDAQHVLRDFAEPDQAEDERGHCRPEQQFPARTFHLLRLAQAHRADFLRSWSDGCAVKRLSNRKP